jgi:hypothetical protein
LFTSVHGISVVNLWSVLDRRNPSVACNLERPTRLGRAFPTRERSQV